MERNEQKKQVYALCQRADRLCVQGQYGQAEAMFQQALALAETVFAPDVLEEALAPVLNNHAVLYKYSGQFDEAEQLYRRALHLAVRHLGEDHPEIATLYHNLGGSERPRARL
jgi:tetratricopeptide (TPR) repeat protein